MKKLWAVVAVLSALACGNVHASKLKNPGFESDFGPRQDMHMWGDYGEAWGETCQVQAGREGHPARAKEGNRVLLINLPVNSWNGIWQQMPWDENKEFKFDGYYLIQGGDLHDGCDTFLKVEFLDGNDQSLGEVVGEKRKADTGKKWVRDSVKGQTPPGTASLRFVIIAGDNANGPAITSRIYWDDMKVGD